MAFDFKKEYKEFYLPPRTPTIVTVPPMHYIAVRGQGDPNVQDGSYQEAIGLLYAVAYTIKMSKKSDRRMEGYFDYVVPPLEGFWQQDAVFGVDPAHKESFRWISVIRLPDFVTQEDLAWAVQEAAKKKPGDFSRVEYLSVNEGLCVQCLHVGAYDDEPATVGRMHAYMAQEGFLLDITEHRLHHEIYLSDARRVPPEKRRTMIRHPIRPAETASGRR
ncbi:MAG: GyrI-like domain-containing protein [Oscillospiraceae bacterium]|nr:GyrI-like domain-containing protein [Oscillospiraceae bacterium]